MPPRFLYPFLPYRSFIVPILVLSAVTIPCWLLFRLYRVRTSARRVSWPREILLLIFVAYLSGLAAVTLVPNRPSREVAESALAIQLRPNPAALTCSSARMREGSTAQGFCRHNATGNLLLFIPLGFLIPLVWERLRFAQGLLIALGVSIGIELLQYLSRTFGSMRTADVNDVILNVVGAGLGLVVGMLLRWRPGTRAEVRRA
jgi:glycopeptide antibiotics resistance protein